MGSNSTRVLKPLVMEYRQHNALVQTWKIYCKLLNCLHGTWFQNLMVFELVSFSETNSWGSRWWLNQLLASPKTIASTELRVPRGPRVAHFSAPDSFLVSVSFEDLFLIREGWLWGQQLPAPWISRGSQGDIEMFTEITNHYQSWRDGEELRNRQWWNSCPPFTSQDMEIELSIHGISPWNVEDFRLDLGFDHQIILIKDKYFIIWNN